MRARAVLISRAKCNTWAGLALGVLTLSAAPLLPGCAIGEADIHRWETTEHGPEKLFAILTHDKYALPLRAEAAMSLVRMRPRAGQRIGLNELIHALEGVPDDARTHIVSAIAPTLIELMKKPAPAKAENGTIPPDESTPYKDAAFGLLSHEPSLITDEAIKKQVTDALTQWVQTSFEARIDNSGQAYGVEPMMRFIGSSAVRSLPSVISESSSKNDRASGLIADLGDAETKVRGSEALVTLAKRIDSPEWIERQKPLVEEVNKRSPGKVSAEALAKQLSDYQEQELEKVFSNMKRLGGRPVVNYCIAYARDAKKSEKMRSGALAAIENHVEKGNKADVDQIFDIVRDDKNPARVRSLALSRLGELPKDQVVPKLYTLFDEQKWQVRIDSAKLVLKTATLKDIPDFMHHLPQDARHKMALSEPITYAAIIMGMEDKGGGKPKDALTPFLQAKEIGPKLVAIGAYYQAKKADMSALSSLEGDSSPVPKCAPDDQCGWMCLVPKPGAKEPEQKTIVTVGDFVKYCVEPSGT